MSRDSIFAKMVAGGPAAAYASPMGGFIRRREDGYYRYLDQRLGEFERVT